MRCWCECACAWAAGFAGAAGSGMPRANTADGRPGRAAVPPDPAPPNVTRWDLVARVPVPARHNSWFISWTSSYEVMDGATGGIRWPESASRPGPGRLGRRHAGRRWDQGPAVTHGASCWGRQRRAGAPRPAVPWLRLDRRHTGGGNWPSFGPSPCCDSQNVVLGLVACSKSPVSAGRELQRTWQAAPGPGEPGPSRASGASLLKGVRRVASVAPA
jgi:hypothetical protein